MSRGRRIPEHLSAVISDDEQQLRYEFTAQQLFNELGLNKVNDQVVANLRFNNPKAFSLIVVFRAYRALLDRDQVASRHSSGNHWVFYSDLVPETNKQLSYFTT